ncbi:MAG: NAD(P)H-dependent oxidoreductase [Planctomycetes bacterium]|nr:NAD(P)H-dependent oxidoreductase [Planctomycetota bacterium]
MSTISSESLLQQLQWRYAVKKFDPTRRIPKETWATLERALVLSPSSFGIQPWKFIVVETPTVREKLMPVSWNQRQIVDASHLVVFARRTDIGPDDAGRLTRATAAARGVPEASLEAFKGMLTNFLSQPKEKFAFDAWAGRQVYLALGTLLTSAAMLGVDACPMEGLEPAKYDEILGLKEKDCATLCVATLGYRAADDKYASAAKVRYAAGEVILRA